MKHMTAIAVLLFVSGCAALYSQSISGVVQTTEEYTLDRITESSDALNISALMAGDKAVFIEFGADSCLVAEVSRRNDRYTVEIVSFLTPKGALGAYTATILDGGYPAEVGERARKNDRRFQFLKGSLIATIEPKDDAGMSGAEALALSLASRMKGVGISVDMFSALPKKDIVPESERFFMGKRVFGQYFSDELATDLGIGNIKEGVTAKYRTADGDVDFIKIRFYKAEFAKDAVNTYLKSRSDLPVLLPRESLPFYTIVLPDRSESYIADYAEWIYVMPAAPPGGKGRMMFEYILRGGR